MDEKSLCGRRPRPWRISIVGPCASGKSTLASALKDAGFEVRQPAQEHSYVPNMWQRMTHPDVLIYLDVDYANTRERIPHVGGGPERLAEQHRRLANAREHCDLFIDTSGLTPEQVRSSALSLLVELELKRV